MSETPKNANVDANVEVSDEPTESTTPSSVNKDESAEAAVVADDNAVQIPSAGLHATPSVDYNFFCSLFRLGITPQDYLSELQSYLDDTKLYGDEELSSDFLSIQEKLKVFLSPDVVNEINNLEGDKILCDLIRRNYSFLDEDVAKTLAKKAHNYILKHLILNIIENYDPEVINQSEQIKLALVYVYKNTMRSYKLKNISEKIGSSGGVIETNDASPSESSDAPADVSKTVESLKLNKEKHDADSGTSKDDPVGRNASSQSDSNKSDGKDDSKGSGEELNAV